MKLITAIVRPSRLEAGKASLSRANITGMTVSDVQGVGRQRGHKEVYRGHEYQVDLIRKVKIEVAVSREVVEGAIDAIVAGARSGAEGEIGDGKIFVTSLEDVIRIRTQERAEAAI